MGELDILLAKEFSRRHGLYDKKSPHFKDREYNDYAWKEIAAKLGYSVDILKDRMLQLRNRYNVEKRKYENLCAKYPNSKAQWPLYYHLNFLDGHIRPRRAYRSIGSEGGNYSGSLRVHQTLHQSPPSPPPLVKAPTAQINPVARRRGRPPKKFVYPPEYCNNGDLTQSNSTQLQQMVAEQKYVAQMQAATAAAAAAAAASPAASNSDEEAKDDDDDEDTDEVLVKCEVVSNSDGAEEDEQEESNSGEFLNPVSMLVQTTSAEGNNTANSAAKISATATNQHKNNTTTEEYEQPTQSNTANNNGTRSTAPSNQPTSSSNSPALRNNNTHHNNTVSCHNNETTTTESPTSKKRRNEELILKLHRSPCKYQAFGQFIAASLSELADDRALNLIEKFTIQMVSIMRENNNVPPDSETNK